MKKRADIVLFEKDLAESRSKAQAMIMAGQIRVDGKKITKSGTIIDPESEILVSNLHSEWVSRGAIKIIHAINFFEINIQDYICLDIGSSTGGFTEVLLSKKTKKIYAVDVGTNQLHEKLRKHNKGINISKTNSNRILKSNKHKTKSGINYIHKLQTKVQVRQLSILVEKYL